MIDVKRRYEGIQTVLGVCGAEGCHFLTLLTIAEEHSGKTFDLIDTIHVCIDLKYVRPDFYVLKDCEILRLLTGKKWTRKDVEKLPPIGDNDYTEAIYFNPRTQFHHYRRRYMDTLEHSVTVEEGYIESYRVYTVHD